MRSTPLPRAAVAITFAIAIHAGSAAAQKPGPEAELIAAAKASHTDALFLWKDGRVLIDSTAGPIELMSAFKSVVALGIGRLVEEGKIASLDLPIHTLYPEWNQGRKKTITIRHLMNHTSGLQNDPNAGAEIYPAPNAVQLALAAELSADPGTDFSYNNKAVNLLAGVIEKASGSRMDLYLQEHLFDPLGITRYQWYFDRSGTPHAMAGLQLEARDVAKFGQLILDRGLWNGKRLVGEAFLDEMTRPGQPYYPLVGLLWWIRPDTISVALRPEAVRGRARGSALARLAPLAGKVFGARPEARQAATAILGPGADSALIKEVGPRWFDSAFAMRIGRPAAFYADGYLGQYLVVIPETRVVAVRQIRNSDRYNQATDGFPDFVAMVIRLASAFGTGRNGAETSRPR